MPYITRKIENVPTNYQNKKQLIEKDGIFTLEDNNNDLIPEFFVLIHEETFEPVEAVNKFLIHKYLLGTEKLNFECRALRLYFDFLEAINKEWDEGSKVKHQRPVNMFSKYIQDCFKKGEMSGSVASGYFSAVVRFYKFYLELGHPFKGGEPISFKTRKIEVNNSNFKNHLSKYMVEVFTADCAPRIPANSNKSILNPLSKTHYDFMFKQLKEHGTKEFLLMCLLSASTGLRVNEIVDLKSSQIDHYNGEDIFDLYVGPKANHNTKNNKNAVIKVSGSIISLIKEYHSSATYLRRLSKFEGKDSFVFISNRGEKYNSESISVMFNKFMHQHLKPTYPDFQHKFHDLRVYFGVNVMKACLNAKLSRSEALAYTQNQMRHNQLDTTLHYLEYWTHSEVNEQKVKLQDEIIDDIKDIFKEE